MGSLRFSPCGRRRKNHALNPTKKKRPEFKAYKPSQSQLDTMREQQQKQYNSIMEEYMQNGSYHDFASDCTKKEAIKYTGTLVKGIATMHKSNAVPVISQQEAEDISKMRRN